MKCSACGLTWVFLCEVGRIIANAAAISRFPTAKGRLAVNSARHALTTYKLATFTIEQQKCPTPTERAPSTVRTVSLPRAHPTEMSSTMTPLMVRIPPFTQRHPRLKSSAVTAEYSPSKRTAAEGKAPHMISVQPLKRSEMQVRLSQYPSA